VLTFRLSWDTDYPYGGYTDFSQPLQIIGGISISNQTTTTSCHMLSSHQDILRYIALVTYGIVGYSANK
jgi:hypothetical protein